MFASKDLFFSKPSGYQISRSVRLRSSASAYFNRTPASASNRKTWTWSAWIKRGTLGTAAQWLFTSDAGSTDQNEFNLVFTSSDQLSVGGALTTWRISTPVYRDPSAWYHIVLAVDTTQSTANNRIRLYVNGVEVTAFGTLSNPTLNDDLAINQASQHNIGIRVGNTSPFDGYIAEVNFIDGQALTPSSFGQTSSITGVWEPIKYTGTYGTNGFYLNFSDNSNNTATTIGKDYSGNGNNWTPNNISVTAGVTYDSMLDVPTPYADGGNGRGNYATLNPIAISGGTPTEANLRVGNATTTGTRATFGATSGKFYWETTVNTLGNTYIGLIPSDTFSNGYTPGQSFGVNNTGDVFQNSANTGLDGLPSIAANDVIGMAVDFTNKLVWWGKNGQWYSGNAAAETTITASDIESGLYGFPYSSYSGNDWVPMFSTSTAANNVSVNFGQRPFTYTPPTGFVALNTQNLPTPTISNGASYMAATTYTGTGSTLTIANTVGSASFQPDFVWVKGRSGATDHALYDAVRGVQKQLESNTTTAETTETTGLTAFGTTGFTIGALAQMNTNTATYVAWQWQAGGSTVTNTSGTISSQVRANPTAGFSIVTYTGTGANATVGHGLGVAPKMVIVKNRGQVDGWAVYHANQNASPASGYTALNETAAFATTAVSWNNTVPTSTVFSVGTSSRTNASAVNMVAYCFAAVAGYSAFGSYTGNGSTDGPFVYLNFYPRFVMLKRTDVADEWAMHDSARPGYNATNLRLIANSSGAELATQSIDLTSNGFKIKSTSSSHNASGGTYIYMAFAENPFKNSLAR